MQTQIFKSRLFTASMIILFIFSTGFAQGGDFKKYVEKKFQVNKDASLMIKNKFGDIHCQVWNESSVSIKVEITVEASSQEKANKVLNRINVELSGDQNQVKGVTEVDNMSFNNAEFSIDYFIMMPKSLNVDLNNSFGEIYVEEVDGDARINLEYGEMEVDALNGNSIEITLKFSEGSVDYMKNGKVSIEYGELDSKGANKLEVRSRFSELNLDKLETLVLDSQYDDISIGSTGDVEIIARFSDVEIEQLNGNFNLDAQYGEFSADYIHAGFDKGYVKTAFSGVSLEFDPKASFKVDAEMKFCTLSYPASGSKVTHSEQGYTTNLYKGTIGPDSSPTASLVIVSQNGDVDISY